MENRVAAGSIWFNPAQEIVEVVLKVNHEFEDSGEADVVRMDRKGKMTHEKVPTTLLEDWVDGDMIRVSSMNEILRMGMSGND